MSEWRGVAAEPIGRFWKSMNSRHEKKVLSLLVIMAVLWSGLARADSRDGKLFSTAHYTIRSTATSAQTTLVANAVESLHTEYLRFFADRIPAKASKKKLLLRLYKDQDEFKKHNKATFWAEAYYSPPSCHAYFAGAEKNPYHWMTHEATHQLNHEVALLPSAKWINEGIATYFGASVIRKGRLITGQIDVNTYPIWMVKRLRLTGDMTADIRRGKIIGLRALISGIGGPNIDEKVNTYYVGYWSLSHFLFHFEDGRYAQQYRALLATPGSIDDFEKLVGPIDRIQEEWYGYLQQRVANLSRERARK
jgi:hypothetical protein